MFYLKVVESRSFLGILIAHIQKVNQEVTDILTNLILIIIPQFQVIMLYTSNTFIFVNYSSKLGGKSRIYYNSDSLKHGKNSVREKQRWQAKQVMMNGHWPSAWPYVQSGGRWKTTLLEGWTINWGTALRQSLWEFKGYIKVGQADAHQKYLVQDQVIGTSKCTSLNACLRWPSNFIKWVDTGELESNAEIAWPSTYSSAPSETQNASKNHPVYQTESRSLGRQTPQEEAPPYCIQLARYTTVDHHHHQYSSRL